VSDVNCFRSFTDLVASTIFGLRVLSAIKAVPEQPAHVKHEYNYPTRYSITCGCVNVRQRWACLRSSLLRRVVCYRWTPALSIDDVAWHSTPAEAAGRSCISRNRPWVSANIVPAMQRSQFEGKSALSGRINISTGRIVNMW